VEEQIRRTQKVLEASKAQDASHAARRLYAVIVGFPLGVVAFIYLGFLWGANNGTGVYIGITCAAILWLIVRHIRGLPESDTHTIEMHIAQLDKERERTQESLRKYMESEEPAPKKKAKKKAKRKAKEG